LKCQGVLANHVYRLSETFANILGFRKQSVQKPVTTAVHPTDTYPGLNCVMVFTNIIEESSVGDTRAPLLRLLPFKSATAIGDVMSYSCYPIQYKHVTQSEISCLRILIADDSGRELPFKSDRGRVSLTLHFKQREQRQLA
jgi:hypothetical protein